MIPTEGFAQVEVRSAAELRAWLLAHHGQAESVWLVTWKKAPGAPYVSVQEVLDELIAFGWIDGLRRKRDDGRTMQLISPRRQQAWAASYKQRAERLEAKGRMHSAGQAAIAAAKAAGRWDETAEIDALVVPEDLTDALRGSLWQTRSSARLPLATGGMCCAGCTGPSGARRVPHGSSGSSRCQGDAKSYHRCKRRCEEANVCCSPMAVLRRGGIDPPYSMAPDRIPIA